AKQEVNQLTKRLYDLRQPPDGQALADTDEISSLIAADVNRIASLRVVLATAAELSADGGAKALDKTRELYLSHRELLLNESAVSQLRGTFAVVRRLLFFGALLTLLGGITYASAVANPHLNSGIDARVLVTAKAESDSWTELEECRGDAPGDITGLSALLKDSDDADGLQDGPFTIVTTQANCAGLTVDFKNGDGTYQSTGEPAAAAPVESDETAKSLVTATLEQNTPGSKAVLAACPLIANALSTTGISAILTSSQDADAQHDGPFTIETAEPQCAGIRVEVANGDGSYQVVKIPVD
ncbi:MAG: hypothetical protein JWQ43_957, partial [Glaciihabitans sp.]|nr:hypothetical protein [Glaciihabitans sp.]